MNSELYQVPDQFRLGKQLYTNPLMSDSDTEGFRLEGRSEISFPDRRLRMANVLGAAGDQSDNCVFWCPEDFPADIAVFWEFWPLQEPGLSMFFFAATGRNGEDLFDLALAARNGHYPEYHHGDINAFHVAYFRRNPGLERAFHTVHLRKSYGGDLMATGADPIPDTDDADSPYRLVLIKCGPDISFSINGLQVISRRDSGKFNGPLLGGGKIGFRQMAPLVAEYANLTVHEVGPSITAP